MKLIISDAGNYLTWGKTYPYRGYEIKANHSAEIDDGKWFIGSVFGFKYDCQDCASGIIKLKKKIIKTESTYLGMTE